MLAAAAAAAALAIVPHAVLDHDAALGMLYRYLPCVVRDNVILTRRVKSYAAARSMLEFDAETRGILDSDLNLYVVNNQGNATVLRTVLWRTGHREQDAHFHALRAWHAARCPGRELLGDALLHWSDRVDWYESIEDEF